MAGTPMRTLGAERPGGLAVHVWPAHSLAVALDGRFGALQTFLAGFSLGLWEPPNPGMQAMSRRSAEDGIPAPVPMPGGVGPPAAAASGVGASTLLLLSALLLLATPALLRRLRDKLRHNRITCPLFDSEWYRRHIEAAYMKMWEIWQRGDSPRSFTVDPI